MHTALTTLLNKSASVITIAAVVFATFGFSIAAPAVALAATPVTVTIEKYVDGAQATALSANSQDFPMLASGTVGGTAFGPASYALSASGYNGNPTPYQAMTGGLMTGDNYATNEDTAAGNVVGDSCDVGKQFSLVGYTSGDTLAQAQAATPSLTPPSFTTLANDKFVIVWNQNCAAPTVSSVSPTTGAAAGGDTVTLTGTGFNGATAIDFGATPATNVSITNDNSLTATSPAGTGTVDVTVMTPQGVSATSTADQFTYTPVVVPPTTVHVTINKFVDGAQANATNANSSSFPMSATWNDPTGIGSGTGSYTLDNTSAPAYQAMTGNFNSGSDYSTNEVTGGAVVGANCAAGAPFALVGYTTGSTFAAAASGTPTTTIPAFTGMTSNQYVIVWNHDCSNSSGTIGGSVSGGAPHGTLGVTSIDSTRTTATADGTFANGWIYTFHITVPNNETNLAMKFADWTNNTASSTMPTANNMRISSAQADNGNATVLITAANTYSSPALHITGDLDPATPGMQIDVKVEVSVPTTTTNGSYTTSYGVRTLP